MKYYIKEREMTPEQATFHWEKTHEQYEELELLFLSLYEETKPSFKERPKEMKFLTIYQYASFGLIFVIPLFLIAAETTRTELFYVVVFMILVGNFAISAAVNHKKTGELHEQKAAQLLAEDEEILEKLYKIQQIEREIEHQKPLLMMQLQAIKMKNAAEPIQDTPKKRIAKLIDLRFAKAKMQKAGNKGSKETRRVDK
ncbi:hypothetical protein NRIC_16140 [Enterococcus florum]|uniref:Uncharacterized protein n=1 Tax=Enterococcus florum TaxID=2480627 RepID=A0A4P5PK63_9ENTE|nr:hypothetical protein [Enterococcus florum]GCF93723.1 hypothetical protein NRIC_16140 [Enterococcus florum]